MKTETSDTLLRSQICEALEQFDEEDFSKTGVRVENQEVTLSGSVPSEIARERSLELVKKIRGVRKVLDRLEIR